MSANRELVKRLADAYDADNTPLPEPDHPVQRTVFLPAGEEDNVAFRQVGRNATHFFYLGVDKWGQRWSTWADMSGEDSAFEWFDQVYDHVEPANGELGYIGHH